MISFGRKNKEVKIPEDVEERLTLALDPKTSAEILEKLAKNEKDHRVLEAVAGNHNTPPGVLRNLAKYDDDFVKARVAGNHNTPVDVLSDLAKVMDGAIDEALVRNPNTPEDVLRRIGRWAKIQVAKDPKTPAEILEKLAKDNIEVRTAVAENYSASKELLLKLTVDEALIVRETAKETLQRKGIIID